VREVKRVETFKRIKRTKGEDRGRGFSILRDISLQQFTYIERSDQKQNNY